MATSDIGNHPGCPHCTGHGLARSVTLKNGHRTVSYECEVCKQRWDITDKSLPSTWARAGTRESGAS